MKGIVILIAIGYFALAILFVYNIFSLGSLYEESADAYTREAESAIHAMLQEYESEEQIDELIEKYPMELVILQEDGPLYRTVKVNNLNIWFGNLNRDAISLEAQFETSVQGVPSEVWFCLYQVSEEAFLMSFLIRQSLLLLVLFVVALISIIYGQKLLHNPLKEIKKSISKANEYEFDDISSADDEVNRGFEEFTQKVDKTLHAISHENTKLETELQHERERMKNAMTVARSLVHNLKAPVHQNLMENEAVMLKNEDETIKSLTLKNVTMSDRVLKRINETLDLLRDDAHENIRKEEVVDVEELYMEIIQLYHHQIKEKKLRLDVFIDESSTAYCSRASFQLLAHNLVSNMIQYAIEKSVLVIDVRVEGNKLILQHTNQGALEDIERMKKTENLFNVVQMEKSETNKYSGGNGLFLIRDLTEIMGGTYTLDIQGDSVKVQVELSAEGSV